MSCKCARPTDEFHGCRCTITDGECMFLFSDSKACAELYGEGPDADIEELEDEGEETCGNPYTDLWASLKFTIELSDYCKGIREEATAPAFVSALCQKCIDKECKFLNICVELHEINRKDHENEEE